MKRTRLVTVLWIGVATVVAYWVLWFTQRSLVASEDNRAYVVFENAFPVADAWLAITYAGAAISLQRRRPIAMWWLIAAGSASLYLAGMDILFDLENGVYLAGDVGARITEMVINVASIAIGVWTLRAGWVHRKELLQ